jgi:hypothetical protein
MLAELNRLDRALESWTPDETDSWHGMQTIASGQANLYADNSQ